jgi:hypothetical protein
MTERRAGLGRISSAAAGALVGAVAWMAIVPWDLSTFANGRPIPGALDDSGQLKLITAAFLVPCVVAIAAGAAQLIRPLAFSLASGTVCVTLTTWRGMAAEVHGANMAVLWPVAGVPAVLVSAAVVVTATGLIAALQRRRARAPRPTPRP